MALDTVQGFASSPVFVAIDAAFAEAPPKSQEDLVKRIQAVYQFDIQGPGNKTQTWTLDLKNTAEDGQVVSIGTLSQPDTVLKVADKDFVAMSRGQLTGQRAFITGKLKVRGNVVAATKLDAVFKLLKNTKPATTTSPPTSTPSTTTTVAVKGFESSAVLQQIASAVEGMAPPARKSLLANVNGVIQLDITNASNQKQAWVLDLQPQTTTNVVRVGPAQAPITANVILSLSDYDFVAISQDKLRPQAAYITGKLKLQGNMALAMKLETVLKAARPQAKL
ncbi:hypothetical protein H4R34_004505 [Dimargaris verticillata]|uniref:SCP2 domain-containing protein n=1 Tax=Dimargaris verticillata TaxID=2761393 RepID=A0A9W8AYP8_9FUNG|nr:hypothetical protein H4R34_004505 [Dimargaris verticillata]